ncbi:1-pyrroline-5-carboxylate dehydrogenase [candidate division WOR-1 bacterium DG_54_3]|uniref:L-glutamate gamma-semialdehyde dehydrogenase n=1 Tax=candidate division WOR-1 bacterium DG_54_3 TaxID=1703775 RepID=A0A0S7Y5L7_UNCSA|nr:MAG: 1-pyrroline-5-carboxylate dehydrogenase [candidate division WOR-1 bacterium DG_54_3]
MNAIVKVPRPTIEPIFSYAPGSPEKTALKAQLKKMLSETWEFPIIIGGKEVKTGNLADCRCPHDHNHLLAHYHKAGPEEIELAVQEAKKAWKEWSEMDWVNRAAVFLRAAELLATKYRDILNASTMLGQSKTVHQAEIDSACELIDFYRFNPYYMNLIYTEQPDSSAAIWNYMEYRALEGFVFAVTPFNFSSIAGNLPTSPAMMGNVVLWKPASSAVYSAYFLTQLWKEAGLPDGVINFIPGPGRYVGDPVLEKRDLAGIHFTGSTAVFQSMWKTIGASIMNYHSYPRIVGETGGKDFVFVHASADGDAVVTALVRGAFEYQGQKCSAASRAYIPQNLWAGMKDSLVDQIKTIKMGDIMDFSNFMGAVIDKPAFNSIVEYIEYAKNSSEAEVIAGGNYDDSKGYFIEPTVVVVTDPKHKLMEEEIFGPVLTIYVYPENEYRQTLELCNTTSPYGLTGSIFANDRSAIDEAYRTLRHSAGNFYINDKPTGAVVSQQPFGGARGSGTNDKAGSYLNLLRWVSARAIKENLNPPKDYRYPYMDED